MRTSVSPQTRCLSLTSGFLAAMMGLAPASQAAPSAFWANLSGNTEVPATGSLGTGTAIVIVDPALHTLHVSVTFSGLTGLTTASHIHCCEATPGANLNVGVATTTPTFAGFPLGVTSGTYDSVLDLTSAASYNPAFITSASVPTHTVAGAEAVLIAGIQNVETYLNIHSTIFPGGEIRGILVAPVLTPLVPAGAGSNAFAVSHAIDAVFASGSAPPEFIRLLTLPAASLPATLDQITGQNESAAAQTGHESVREFLALVLDPFTGTRPEQQAAAGRGAIWGAAYGGHQKIAGTQAAGNGAQTIDGGALAIGYDYSSGPGTFFGAAFTFGERNFDIRQSNGSGRDNDYQFGLYGKTDFDTVYLAAAGAYSIYDLSSARAVSYTGVSGSYGASYNAHGFGGRLEGGLHFTADRHEITPFAAIVADTIDMPSYSETTKSGASVLATKSPEHSFDRVRSELGVGLNTTFDNAGVPVLFHGRVGWAHEFSDADTIPFAFVAFPNQSFTIAGAKLEDTGFVSAGLVVPLAPDITLGGNLEGDFGSATRYGGSLQLRVAL